MLLQTTIALNVFRSKNILLPLKYTGKHRVDVTTTLNQTATSRNITEHKIESVGQSSITQAVERVHAYKCKAIIKFQATFFLNTCGKRNKGLISKWAACISGHGALINNGLYKPQWIQPLECYSSISQGVHIPSSFTNRFLDAFSGCATTHAVFIALC